jgi:cytidylate kinase
MHLINLQRQIAAGGDFVCEGRDQGTVVFPDAECKFYLDASPEHRARRRVLELEARNVPVDYTVLLKEQARRDKRDCERPFGKLEKANDAIEIQSDDKTLHDVVAIMKQAVLDKIGTTRS